MYYVAENTLVITIVKFVLVNILIPLICWCGDEGEKESPGSVDNAGLSQLCCIFYYMEIYPKYSFIGSM